MGGEYASSELQERVKQLICEKFHPKSVIYPGIIERIGGVEHNQVKGALKKIAPRPGVFVDIGAESKLTRTYVGLGLLCPEPADLWYYDPPGAEFLPFFPILHQWAYEFSAKFLPRIHVLLHPNREESEARGFTQPAGESSPRGVRCTIKTY
jgi:hypothetical protein